MTSKPRYFLAGYLSAPGTDAVLAPRHDQNLTLFRVDDNRRIEIVRMWELERLSGQKHHYWPLFSQERMDALVTSLLAAEGLTVTDIEASFGTPGLPRYDHVPVPSGAGAFPVHSLAHLFSGLLLDTDVFTSGTVFGMALDGGPDFLLDADAKRSWYAGCVVHEGRMHFAPMESPAPLFAAARARFGLEPGSLMALASATDTTMRFDPSAVDSLKLFGGAEQPLVQAVPFVNALARSAEKQLAAEELDSRFTRQEHVCSAVMKAVQTFSELIVDRNVTRLQAASGVSPRGAHLAASGGFALNCPTNSYLLDRFGFVNLLTPPCANDSGQSLGLGLMALALDPSLGRSFQMADAYHGRPVRDADSAIARFAEHVLSVEPFSPERFVADVIDGPLAWVEGAAEIGPRALGHRSLLADPRSTAAKDRLNDIKQRQWWRPVAPLVLESEAGAWFSASRPSPFMLQTATVLPERRAAVPAILHLDDTARHQTVPDDADGLLPIALRAFAQATGVPILCNTSLNDRGEPIIDTAEQALTFCLRKGIPLLYVNGARIELSTDATVGPIAPRESAHFVGQDVEHERVWHSLLNRGLQVEALFAMTRSPRARRQLESLRPEVLNQLGEVGRKDQAFASGVQRFVDMFGPSARFAAETGPEPVRWEGFND